MMDNYKSRIIKIGKGFCNYFLKKAIQKILYIGIEPKCHNSIAV